MHGFAGDLAAEELGPDGMTARDVLEMLPDAVATFREEYEEIVESYYGTIEIL
jgi:NAD(P)H-hydrate epimerase